MTNTTTELDIPELLNEALSSDSIESATVQSVTGLSAAEISAADGELKESIEELEMVLQYARASQSTLKERKKRITSMIREANDTVAAKRRAFNEALTSVRELESEKIALSTDSGTMLSSTEINRVLSDVKMIRGNDCVADLSLTSGSMRIKLKPIVFQDSNNNSDNRKYLIDNVIFTLSLGATPQIRFARETSHPHVQRGASTPCWGQADTHVRQALASKQYATVVTLVSGWASIYNGNSPYNAASSFPEAPANAPIGYQL